MMPAQELVREVIAPQAPLRRAPQPDASLDTEALLGEAVTLLDDNREGWCRVRLHDDGYEGWMPDHALGAPHADATHKVAVARTFAFPGPSIKIPPVEALSFGCRVAVMRSDDTFAVTAHGWHIPVRHLVPIDAAEADPVAIAERLLHTPYLWGGKTSLGIDCSGLVQLALNACGITCPRDSGPQRQAFADEVALEDAARGDLLFWDGHVAILRDREMLIHANAWHMAVAIEPVAAAIARIAAAGSDLLGVKRYGQNRRSG